MISKKTKSETALTSVFVLMAIIAGFILRAYGLHDQPLSYFDEAAYILEAAKIAGYEPSAPQYYARPGYVFILAGIRFFWDEPIMAARVISIASFFGSIVVMWFLVDRIFDVRTRNLSIIIFSLLPLDVYYSRLIFPDSFSAFLLLSSGLFFLEATRTEKFNVAGRQSVDARWLIAAGFCAGYFLTVGSYRVAPIVATVGLVCITTMFRLMAEDRDLWWKSGLALLGVATPIVFFQSQYSFLDQMLNLAFLFPRQDGAGSIDLDPYYYTYIFVYFFFPIFITLLAYIV